MADYYDGVEIRSRPARELINMGGQALMAQLKEMHQLRTQLSSKRSSAQRKRARLERRIRFWTRWRLFAHRIPDWSERAHDLDLQLLELDERIAETSEHTLSSGPASEGWEAVEDTFNALQLCEKVWDTSRHQMSTHYKSSAAEGVIREPTRVNRRVISLMDPSRQGLCLVNSNGPDIALYPVAVAVLSRTNVLIPWEDVEITYSRTTFVEDEVVPADAEVVGETWRYVNRDGGPDRRFSDNPRCSIALYGNITVQSNTGLHEVWQFSNHRAAEDFVNTLKEWLSPE